MAKWVVVLVAAVLIVPICFGIASFFRRPRSIVLIRAGNFRQHEYIHECFENLIRTDNALRREKVTAFVVPDVADKIAATSICDAALQAPADCIVVVGRLLTQITVGQARRRGVTTPIVFIGADKPVELGLVESLDVPGGSVTGLFTTAASEALCGNILNQLCPSVKTVLLPFALSAGGYSAVLQRAVAIRDYLKAKNVEVFLAEMDHSMDALKRIEVLLSSYDAVMTLEDDALNEALVAGLGRLALRHGKLFFSGTSLALAEGATLTYGLELRYSVEAAVEMIKQILYKGKSPAEMPVLRLGSSRELIINTERARELGINLDLQALERAIATDPALVCVRGRLRVL